MPKMKSPEEFFQRAHKKGSDISKGIVNGDEVQKELQPKNTRGPWVYGTGRLAFSRPGTFLPFFTDAGNRYAQDRPGADPYDLETLKDLVREMAYGIDGTYGDATVGEKPVLQYWKDFTAGWRRHKPTVPSATTLSVTNVGSG